MADTPHELHPLYLEAIAAGTVLHYPAAWAAEARAWATECLWTDGEDNETWNGAILLRGVARHYAGGLEAFVADSDVYPPRAPRAVPTDTGRVLGPLEARIRWEPDPEPLDTSRWAHPEDAEGHDVEGCIVETRAPALLHPDAPAPAWQPGPSLWAIVGADDAYRAEVERDLMGEVTR